VNPGPPPASRRALILATAFALVTALGAAAMLLLPARPAAPPVPLLWEVSDADNRLYLLGSFHLLRPGDYPLAPEVDAAYADAESLLLELSPRELESPEFGARMRSAARREDGRRLDDALGPELAARLRRWLETNGHALGEAATEVQAYDAWFVGLLVSLTELGRHGLDPALGLDRHLGRRAVADGKPAAGLETGAQQIAFLDTMPADDQRQLLDEALAEAGDPARIDRLHADWRRGDAEALWAVMGEEMRRDHPALYRRMNAERNRAWLPLLERRLAPVAGDGGTGRGDTLVVVGALHLLGEDGLVALLRGKGYRVRRLCADCPQAAPDGR